MHYSIAASWLLIVTLSCCSTEEEVPPFPPEYSERQNNKPFGWQRKPNGPIKEYSDVLTPGEMHEKHVRTKVPLVFRGAVFNSPAIKAWTDDYLRETYGDLDVLVEFKKENRSFTTGRMRLRRFLELYKEKKLYIVSLLPQEMMKDVQAVNSVLCGTFRNFTHESNFWMSNGGTRSVIHFDADENLHCLLAGRKDFMAVEKKYDEWLYMLDKDETAGSSFSEVNPDSIDLHRYPNIAKVPWTYATLYPGDCVYLPSGYIHQVRSYGRTVAVTTLFTNGLSTFFEKDLDYDSVGCDDFDVKSYHSMSDIDFHWAYEKGDSTVDMGYMNVETIRVILLRPAKAYKVLDYERFREFYDGYTFGVGMIDAKTMFQALTEGKQNLTIKDIRNLTRKQLKYLGRGLDPPHGPSTEDGEEVFIMPGEHDYEEDEDEIERSGQQRIQFQENLAEAEKRYGKEADDIYEKVLNDNDDTVIKDNDRTQSHHQEL